MEHFSFADFPLETVAFEIRFDNGFRHWDRAGSLWTRVLERMPSLKVVNGEPAKTSFQYPGHWECSCGIDKSTLVALSVVPLNDAVAEAGAFFSDVVTELDIPAITRIGCRQQYCRPCDSRTQAAQVMTDLRLMRNPGSSMFGLSTEPINQTYATRFEQGAKGINIRVEAQSRTVEFTPAFGVPGLLEVKQKFEVVLVDIDYFSTGIIPIASLRFKDWFHDAVDLVRRGLPQYLNG